MTLSFSRSLATLFHRIALAPPLIRLYDYLAPSRSLGQRGELAAERFLLRNGLVIIARGHQDKFGEIDLIATDGEAIIFVEVKTRTSDHAGSPEEAVDHKKQQHLTKTAYGYLKWHRLTDCRARFDVIAITWPDDDRSPQIIHYENAFEPVGTFQMY